MSTNDFPSNATVGRMKQQEGERACAASCWWSVSLALAGFSQLWFWPVLKRKINKVNISIALITPVICGHQVISDNLKELRKSFGQQSAVEEWAWASD